MPNYVAYTASTWQDSQRGLGLSCQSSAEEVTQALNGYEMASGPGIG